MVVKESKLEDEVQTEIPKRLFGKIISCNTTYSDYPQFNASTYEFVLGDEQIEIGMKAVYKKETEIRETFFDVKTHAFRALLNNREDPDYFLLRANDHMGGLYVLLKDTSMFEEISKIFLTATRSFRKSNEDNFLAYLGDQLRKNEVHFNTIYS